MTRTSCAHASTAVCFQDRGVERVGMPSWKPSAGLAGLSATALVLTTAVVIIHSRVQRGRELFVGEQYMQYKHHTDLCETEPVVCAESDRLQRQGLHPDPLDA